MELDDREIVWISGSTPREMFYEIGKGGIEKITLEFPWFSVWKNGKVIRRCNTALVEEVAYKED